MIIGSLLVPSIGGGVCQTATTLFNNAFELGLPITERHNHSFYIAHYPLGRDATVSWGGPDFGFVNDLDHAILIKTAYTDSTLTFSFYGTDQGRRVQASTGPKVNWRTPETSYALDPFAPRGSVRTVAGSNQAGFDVTVTRSVREGRRLVRRDTFTSVYVAVGPTADLRAGREHPRLVLRAAPRLTAATARRPCGARPAPARCGRRSARRRCAPPRRIVGQAQQLDVLRRDETVREQLLAPSRAAPPRSRVSTRTTGKFSIFPVWISVSASHISSSVPNPPGKITKPSAAFTNIVLRA